MNAVQSHSYGGVDVLVYDVAPRPTPGEGEVLIRIHATSILPLQDARRVHELSEGKHIRGKLVLRVVA